MEAPTKGQTPMKRPSLKNLRRLIRSRLPIPRSWLFSYIYSFGRWYDGKSRSGPGSSLEYTRELREQLPKVISDFGVRTMLDAPCGDFFWMSHVSLGVEEYIGADIVPAMVKANQRRFAREDLRFIVLDVVAEIPPRVDLIFCRDCLFHFPTQLALTALQNFRASGSRYLLTTTFSGVANEEVAMGYHYRINLEAEPFNFPPPILRIQDSPDDPTRFMGLWELSTLP